MNDYAEYRSPAGVLYRGVLSNPEAPTCLYGPYVQKSLEGLEFVRYLSKEECDALPESEYPQRPIEHEPEALRIRDDVDMSILETYGFVKVIKEMLDEEDGDYYTVFNYDYVYWLGHARRGQFYLIGVKGRNVYINSTKPDGAGGQLLFHDILCQMAINNIFTFNQQ